MSTDVLSSFCLLTPIHPHYFRACRFKPGPPDGTSLVRQEHQDHWVRPIRAALRRSTGEAEPDASRIACTAAPPQRSSRGFVRAPKLRTAGSSAVNRLTWLRVCDGNPPSESVGLRYVIPRDRLMRGARSRSVLAEIAKGVCAFKKCDELGSPKQGARLRNVMNRSRPLRGADRKYCDER